MLDTKAKSSSSNYFSSAFRGGLKVDLNPKVCLLSLVLGVQDEKHFPSEPSYKTYYLGDKVLLVLESAGGGDVLEAVVYVLLLHVPGAPRVESSTVEQEPLRFEAGSWVRKSAQCTVVGTELDITKKNFGLIHVYLFFFFFKLIIHLFVYTVNL